MKGRVRGILKRIKGEGEGRGGLVKSVRGLDRESGGCLTESILNTLPFFSFLLFSNSIFDFDSTLILIFAYRVSEV